MDLNLLINNWELTGLLMDLAEGQKIRMALKFEILARHLLNMSEENYKENYSSINVMIFPVLRRICAQRNDDGAYTFYGNVNPLRVLEEFSLWWNSREANDFRSDISVYAGIDVEAEMLSFYTGNFGDSFRNDNYTDPIIEVLKPQKFIKKHKL